MFLGFFVLENPVCPSFRGIKPNWRDAVPFSPIVEIQRLIFVLFLLIHIDNVVMPTPLLLSGLSACSTFLCNSFWAIWQFWRSFSFPLLSLWLCSISWPWAGYSFFHFRGQVLKVDTLSNWPFRDTCSSNLPITLGRKLEILRSTCQCYSWTAHVGPSWWLAQTASSETSDDSHSQLLNNPQPPSSTSWWHLRWAVPIVSSLSCWFFSEISHRWFYSANPGWFVTHIR